MRGPEVWRQVMAVPPHSIDEYNREIPHGGDTPLMFAARSGGSCFGAVAGHGRRRRERRGRLGSERDVSGRALGFRFPG